MKIEISKQESRLIDEAKDLRIVSRLRNEVHHLMKDVTIDDYETYVSATELLNTLEDVIWERIEELDEDEEQSLRLELKDIVNEFKSLIMILKREFENNSIDETIISDLKELVEKLKNISRNN